VAVGAAEEALALPTAEVDGIAASGGGTWGVWSLARDAVITGDAGEGAWVGVDPVAVAAADVLAVAAVAAAVGTPPNKAETTSPDKTTLLFPGVMDNVLAGRARPNSSC